MAFALAVCLGGIIALAIDVKRRLDYASSANEDAVQWTLGQTDVELLALDVAVHDGIMPIGGHTGDQALAEIRTRFDVFYSRVMNMAQGRQFDILSGSPEFASNYSSLRAFLITYAPLIDGPDAALIANLNDLHLAIDDLRKSSRAASLAGLKVYAVMANNARTAVSNTLLLLAVLTVLFILTLITMMVVLVRLERANHARTMDVEAGKARLEAIIAAAQDGVIMLDTRGRIVDCNLAAEKMFCRAPAEGFGADFGELLFDSDQRPMLKAGIASALAQPAGSGTRERMRLQARDANGRRFPVEVTVTATAAVGGNRLVVAFLRDLTDQTAIETELIRARDEAREGERAKASLLAIMSHEVRTPLNGLLGTLELLGHTRLTTQQKEYLRILEASGQLLLHHVNDMLDISRLDSGLLLANPSHLDLARLAREVIDNQTAAAAAQGNAIVLELPEDGRMGLVSDARLLKQALLNLVGNAVKFTEEGVIKLSIRHKGPNGPTEFEVSDTGIGIATADLPRIFDDFVTLDASYSRRQGGTGLGLGIVRRIVSALGGQLGVESQQGKGSTFRFSIPAPIYEIPPEEAAAPAATGTQMLREERTLAVLMVEDNAINRQVLGAMLERMGHRVTEASDAVEGLRQASAMPFDVILMDISMPGMDGMQATRAIRSVDGPNQSTPIVALTAHALPSEQVRFRARGMSDVLIKPVTSDEMAEVLRRLTADTRPPPRPKRRLVARVPAHLAHLVPSFIAEADNALAQIQNLAEAVDESTALMQAVHRLAGSAGLIGADALARKLARIETALKKGDRAQAEKEIADLPGIWETTRADMTANLIMETAPARTTA